jgi:tetratricopeptide (TPR) repeat protein
MDYYSKALEAESTNVAALSSMARLHDRQNNSEKAIEFYQRAIKVAPNQAALNAELGNVHGRIGQVATAKELYQKAINLDPKNRSYRSSLAGLLVDEGQADKAEQELRQVDGPAMANYQMAYLYMSRQNIPETRQYLSKALAIDPNLQPARDMMNSLGGPQLAQQTSGMIQQATQLYQQAGQLGSAVQNAYSPNPNATAPNVPSSIAPAASVR